MAERERRKPPPENCSSTSIFVGNVPYDANEDELKEVFSKAGNVTSIRIVSDRETKQPKGYAFVDFGDPAAVHAAIDKLNNVEYNGRKLRIDWAERELHQTSGGGPRALEDGAPPRGRRGGPPGTDGPQNDVPAAPVVTVADRLARQKEQEAAEKARKAAVEVAERAEIARLMETLTPPQVLHILGEMQRLALTAPEVAKALIAENLQLALALEHAQFLAGFVEDARLPCEPEVKERARSVREKIYGANAEAPMTVLKRAREAQAKAVLQHVQAQAGALLGLPGAPVPGQAALQYGAAAQGLAGRGVVVPGPYAPVAPPAAPRPVAPPRPLQPAAPSAPGIPTAAELASASPEQKQILLGRLVKLSPAEIDQLPHATKVQLLDFLQTMPPSG